MCKFKLETYPSPTSEAQNQWEEKRLPCGKCRKVGSGLESVFIPCTHLADQPTVDTRDS